MFKLYKILYIFSLLLFINLVLPTQAATPPGLPIIGTEDPFSIPKSSLRSDTDKKMPVAINEIGTVKRTQSFENPQNIYALSITGKIGFENEASSVKIILIDDTQEKEYLVYETYPFLTDNSTFSVQEVCEETCVMLKISSFSLRIELKDASIQISEFTYADTAKAGDPTAIKAMQNTSKIQKLNAQNLGWTVRVKRLSQC